MKTNENSNGLEGLISKLGSGISNLFNGQNTSQPKTNELNPDAFISQLQNIAKGEQPDIKSLYEMRQQLSNNQNNEPSGWFGKLSNLIGEAASADARNPGGGFMGALSAGATTYGEKRKINQSEQKKSQIDILKDLMKVSEDQRKYGHDVKKLANDQANKDIHNELYKAQTAKALRPPTGGGANWEDKLLAAEAIKEKARNIEREYAENKATTKETKGILADLTAVADTASMGLDKINNMLDLTDKFHQGFGADVAKYANKLTPGANVEAEEFEAAATEYTLALNQLLKGPTSDKDILLLKLGSPEINKGEKTNKNILNAAGAVFTRQKEELFAADEWAKQHKGSLDDFKIAWLKYKNNNPLLSRDKNGLLKINEKNIGNWKQKLGLDKTKKAQSSVQQPEQLNQEQQPVASQQVQPTQAPQAPQTQHTQPTTSPNPFAHMSKEERDAIRAQVQGNIR